MRIRAIRLLNRVIAQSRFTEKSVVQPRTLPSGEATCGAEITSEATRRREGTNVDYSTQPRCTRTACQIASLAPGLARLT